MSFDFSTLVTDRSQADLDTLRALLSTALTDWTAEQLAAFNQAASRGAYNYTDLNRVTAAMDDLNERLTALGYQTGYQRIVVPHQESGGSVLPEGYTQVAWIESTGSQYINTNFKPTNNTRFVSKVRSQEGTSSSYVWFFGCQNSWSVNGFGVSTWTAEFGNTNTTTGISLYDNKWHELDFNKGTLKIDGNTVWTGQGTFQSSNSLFLFSLNNNGTPSGLRGEMGEILVYEGNELIFDYIPCINPSGEVGLYDLVNGQFYGNSGTGAFLPGPAQVELPDGYAQLEYIESTGTQYINTAFTPNQNSRVICITLFEGTTAASSKGLFGSRKTLTSQSFTFYSYNSHYSSTFNTADNQVYPNLIDHKFIVDKNENVVTVNGQSYIQTFGEFDGSGPIYLFGINNNGSPFGLSSARIYSCKIYSDGELNRDFIPCKNQNGEVGLYDLENNQFYGNDGTGIFVAGPEVPPEPEPEPLDPYTWYEEDVPISSLLSAYLANVSALRGTLTLPANTPAVPRDMDGLTAAEANNIETILSTANDYLVVLQKVFLRSGMAWAVSGGPGFYFVN